MGRIVKLGLLVWLFPVIAYLVAVAVQGNYEGQWRQAVADEVGPEVAADPRNSLSSLCTGARQSDEMAAMWYDICSESGYFTQTLIRQGAVATGLLGTGLLGAIWLIGRMANRDRKAMVRLFSAGLAITLMAVLALVLLHSALALTAIYYGMAVFLERIAPKLLVFTALGGLWAAFQMIRNALALFRGARSYVLGRVLPREQHPALWRFVAQAAERVGTAPPDQIVGGLEPNFFVTEVDVECPADVWKGRTLYVSLPLCHLLTRPELGAIIGHELAHFHGDDTLFSQRFCPIYRGAAGALAAVTGPDGERTGLTLLPAAMVLSFFLDAFAAAESAISRDRESVADAMGAQVAGRENMGTALVKVHAFSKVWGEVDACMVSLLGEGRQLVNASAQFVAWAQEQSTPAVLEGLDQQQIPHPADSHPPLSQRLAALGLRLEDLETAALQTTPPDGAIGLMNDVEALEHELSDMESGFRVQSGQVHLPENPPVQAAD